MKFFAKTDLGKVRQVNQDYYIAENRKVGIFPNIFIVADGVGNNRDSGYASKHCSDFVIDQLSLSKNTDDYKGELAKAYRLANTDLVYRIIANPKYTGMGTTMVATTVLNDKAIIINVGDSRAYHIRENITQITNDHSLAEELVRENAIKRGSQKYYELKSQLSRAFGQGKKIEPDIFLINLRIGDYILLCSDGLSNMVDSKHIKEIVCGEETIEHKVELLINEANKNGGYDNIAVILIYIDEIKEVDKIFEKDKELINKIASDMVNNKSSDIKDVLQNRVKNINENFHRRSRRKKEDI